MYGIKICQIVIFLTSCDFRCYHFDEDKSFCHSPLVLESSKMEIQRFGFLLLYPYFLDIDVLRVAI